MTKSQQTAVARGGFRARERRVDAILKRLCDLSHSKSPNRWRNLRDRYIIESNKLMEDAQAAAMKQGDTV